MHTADVASIDPMTKSLIQLVFAAVLFAVGLADWLGNFRMSHYLLILAGLVLGALAVKKIQKGKN